MSSKFCKVGISLSKIQCVHWIAIEPREDPIVLAFMECTWPATSLGETIVVGTSAHIGIHVFKEIALSVGARGKPFVGKPGQLDTWKHSSNPMEEVQMTLG